MGANTSSKLCFSKKEEEVAFEEQKSKEEI